MKRSKIVSIDGCAVDLSRIKAIRVNSNNTLGPTNTLFIDLNSRLEYVFNPNDQKFEKVKMEDTVEIPYVDYNTARDCMNDLMEHWMDYLEGE